MPKICIWQKILQALDLAKFNSKIAEVAPLPNYSIEFVPVGMRNLIVSNDISGIKGSCLLLEEKGYPALFVLTSSVSSCSKAVVVYEDISVVSKTDSNKADQSDLLSL